MDLDDVELKATRKMFTKLKKEKQMEKLEDLENKLFMLKMQDSWDDSDFKFEAELLEKIRKLQKEVDKN